MRQKQYDDDALVAMLARRGTTFDEIGRRLGISRTTVSQISNGRSRADLQARIIEAREALNPYDRRSRRRAAAKPRPTGNLVNAEHDDDMLVRLVTDPAASTRQIAERAGISEAMVRQILAGTLRADLKARIDEQLRDRLKRNRRSAGYWSDDTDGERRPRRPEYDEELLVELIARGDLSITEIAHRMGLSRSTIWRIIAGRRRPELQPRIKQAAADHRRHVHLLATRMLSGLVTKHISLGLQGEDELARKCREFVIKLVWQEDDDDSSREALPVPLLTAEDYEAIAVLKGGPADDRDRGLQESGTS